MENQKKQQIVYEWLVTLTGKEPIILTENQFNVYRTQLAEGDMRQIIFGDCMLNPVYVVSAIKRPAEYIKRKYPCMKCHSTGRNPQNSDWCENCGGSGVALPIIPTK